MVEYFSCKEDVVGSIPTSGSVLTPIYKMGIIDKEDASRVLVKNINITLLLGGYYGHRFECLETATAIQYWV